MNDLLIVGAGPTGLTAAVELARRGVVARVVDKKPRGSTLSRAVGINARTLSLLEDPGISEKLIETGIKIRNGVLYIAERPELRVDFGLAPKPYDFLLALPQDETERILLEEFDSLGGRVEFGVELLNLRQDAGQSISDLKHSRSGKVENAEFACVFGADGVRSTVRRSAGIGFEGIELPDKWSIVDFDSESWPHRDEICLFAYKKGRVALVVPIAAGRYRGVSDRPDAINNMPSSLKIDRVRNKGEFVIWVKQAPTYQNGSLFLGGDAAHCHSPVGGRGMNLGMADACEFAELFAKEMLERYTSIRHPVGRETILTTERARRFMTSGFPGKFFLLKYVARPLLSVTSLHAGFTRTALDSPAER